MPILKEIGSVTALCWMHVLPYITKALVYFGFKSSKYGIVDYFEFEGIPLSHSVTVKERAEATVEYDNFRPDDILLITFPKAGTHFTRDVMRSIYKEKGMEMSYVFLELLASLHETPTDKNIVATGPLANVDRAPSPRVLSTHLPWSLLPAKAKEGKVKVISCLRNPKDVVCSMFPFFTNVGMLLPGTTWDDFVTWFVEGHNPFGGYFNYIREWYPHRNNSNVLNLLFEDMKKDLEGNVWKIAKFMNIELTQEQVNRIVHDNTFENKKKAMGNHDILLYRKGKSGGWKTDLSVAQNEMVDEWIEREMEGLDDLKLIF